MHVYPQGYGIDLWYCRIPASLDYRDSRPQSPRTRRDSGMTASFQYSSAVCINPIAMWS